jgi:hypothetical protein
MPGVVVPQFGGDAPRKAHLTPDEAMLAEQCLQLPQRLPERCYAGRIALGEPGHEAVQQEIESPRWLG